MENLGNGEHYVMENLGIRTYDDGELGVVSNGELGEWKIYVMNNLSNGEHR